MLRRLLICLCILVPMSALGQSGKSKVLADKPLTNGDVIALVKADLGDEVVIAKIQQAPTESLDVSTDALVRLSRSGVSKGVIQAMLKRAEQRNTLRAPGAAGGAPAAPPASASPGSPATASQASSTKSAQAARPCVENFSEKGEWSAGKAFTSFVDVKGMTADKAYVAIGRAMAKDGYLGIVVSKDLGLVSAYQETGGKKSTLNVTVTETDPDTLRIEAVFTLAQGLRVPAGAMRDEMCKAMELLTLPPGERTDTASDASISLKGEGADKPLKVVVGQFRKGGLGAFITLYFDFSGAKSDVRVAEKRPVLLVRTKTDPAKSYVLVKCEADEDDDKRSIKVGSAGKLLKMGFTGAGELEPDEDWTVPATSTEESPGLWRVVPSKDLKRGEYGLWDIQGYGVALFGVD